MASQQTTGQRPRLSFRRLVRISVALQVIVISVVLAAAAYGALATVRASEQLRNRSRDVVTVRQVQNEFNGSRLALREYVRSGDAFKLGPYSQAQSQIVNAPSTLASDDVAAARAHFDVYVTSIDSYLDQVGHQAVHLVQSGRMTMARRLIDNKANLDRANEIVRHGDQVRGEFDALQTGAEHSVRNRQIVNLALIALAGLLVLGAGMGVMLWIRREMMLPLDELATASRRLGHGDLSARVAPRGVEEIALASAAFNQMADEIEQQVQRLHEASAARSRFVSSVSHELRTPITSLRGYLELLAGGEAGELRPDQQHYVNIAERNARSLDELINDLLTLSRIQSGRISIHPEAVDIRALLRELKAEMLPIAAEKNVDLVLVDTGDLIVAGDPLRLKQAFGNLVGNAIKYSPNGQAVVVRAFRINRQVVVSVVDWGMGIPKNDLPQLAEPFFRSSASERIPGTGLGLPIAKQMIELHGGRLAVESEPGQGSTFTVYLPLRNPADVPAIMREGPPDTTIRPGGAGGVLAGELVGGPGEPIELAAPEPGAGQREGPEPDPETDGGNRKSRRGRRSGRRPVAGGRRQDDEPAPPVEL